MTEAFARIHEAVIQRTGHHYYRDKQHMLLGRLRERMRAHGLSTPEQYEALLASERGEDEWRTLEDAITIGETYFFRYADHFQSLREKVLPKLLHARRDTRSLRIWSIGCSIGAEPYSVAILLRELLGAAIEDWTIAIVGGDISERALEAGRKAVYGAWALRTLGAEERARYFDTVDARSWRLKAEYRGTVRFEKQNLLDLLSPTPPLSWNGFDLILCRNVLIYFAPDTALALVGALRARLADGGSLLLGHAEATLLADPALAAPAMESEFGQALRPVEAIPQAIAAPVRADRPAAAPLRPQPKRDAPAAIPTTTEEVELLRQLADAGEYERAAELCRTLVARDPASAELRYHEAILALVSDDPAGAEAALRKTLYLDRNFILAHYRLGLLLLAHRRSADGKRALATAAQLAAHLPGEAAIPHGQGVTANAFGESVRGLMRNLGEAA